MGNKKKAVAPIIPAKTEPLSEKEYQQALRKLHVELVKLQRWVVHKGLKICIVFEGRDGAGKGGTIKAIPNASARGFSASSPCPRQPSANAASSIFSAISSIFPPPAK